MSTRLVNPAGQYDLAIIGGGPAGASAACAARRLGASVLVIDTMKIGRPPEVIPALALSIFKEQGFELNGLLAGCARVNRFASIWTDGKTRQRSCISAPFGEDIVVDRYVLAKRMRSAAEQMGAIWRSAKVKDISRTSGTGFVLANSDGSTARCRQLIIATGRTPFGALQGNKVHWADSQVAIYPAQNAQAREIGDSAEFILETCFDGWWYGLRASDQSTYPVLVAEARHVARHSAWSHWFNDKLQATAHLSKQSWPKRYALEDLRICSARTSAHRTPCGDGWSLAGDVRLAIDPASGNGVLRAIQDGVRAVDLLSAKHGPRSRRDFARHHVEDWQSTLTQRARMYAAG